LDVRIAAFATRTQKIKWAYVLELAATVISCRLRRDGLGENSTGLRAAFLCKEVYDSGNTTKENRGKRPHQFFSIGEALIYKLNLVNDPSSAGK
jgi:hypothetical protein